MPHFTFKAKKVGGEVYKGEKEARDRYDLYKMMKESGEEIISMEEKKDISLFKNFSLPFLNSIKTQDKINFARNLGSMIKAGLSMSQSLTVMERQGNKKILKKIISSVNTEISEGKTLSQAMSSYPKMFSQLMVAMVKAGEESGTLAESLSVVTLQMDKSYALTRKIRGALMYPGIIFIAMVVIGIVLLTYVVPTLTKTFTELNLELPASTRLILWISDTFQNHYILLAVVFFAVIGSVYLFSKRAIGKIFIHKLLLKIPIIGTLVLEVNVARIARTLSSLVTSGVDLLDSIKITEDIVQNVHYKKIMGKAAVAVEKGDPLSKVFAEEPKLCPVFLTEMVSVGEETGKMGEMLIGVAVYYEDDVDQKTKDMSTIIEPFLMIIIGAAVGFFAVAMITPMYSLVNTV